MYNFLICFLKWLRFSKFKKYLLFFSPCSCHRALARIIKPSTFLSYINSSSLLYCVKLLYYPRCLENKVVVLSKPRELVLLCHQAILLLACFIIKPVAVHSKLDSPTLWWWYAMCKWHSVCSGWIFLWQRAGTLSWELWCWEEWMGSEGSYTSEQTWNHGKKRQQVL